MNDSLTKFKKWINDMIGVNATAYQKNPARADPVDTRYTLDSVREMIASGDPTELQELSKFFYRFSGIYRTVLNFYAHLLLYDYVVIPKTSKTVGKNKLLAKYKEVLNFLDKLDIPATFQSVNLKILRQGVYYGLFRKMGDTATFQDLPQEYCRTRFKTPYGLNVLEFDMRYLERLRSQNGDDIFDGFPNEVKNYYNSYKSSNGKLSNWMVVPPNLGLAFYFEETIPMFVNSMPEIYRLEQIADKEKERAQQQLEKILIHKMPISNKTDETIFAQDEVLAMHEGLVNMLQNNKYVDVLTTYGDVDLESSVDTAAQASKNAIEEFTNTLYDNMGVSTELFNSTGNTALKYSVDRNTSLMYGCSLQYIQWLTFMVNNFFSTPSLTFDIELLPTTIHTRKDWADEYLKTAQYGYSKIYCGAALGIKQSNLMDLIDLENSILNLHDKMIPLQSAHTASNSENSDGKSGKKTNAGDNNSEPGRPELPEADRTDKTQANRDSM